MKRFLVVIGVVILCFVIAGTSSAAELGLKFGSSTITFTGPSGQGADVDFDYVAALYLDFIDINPYSKSGVGPSFEISYAKKSLGSFLCVDSFGNLASCDVDFTYTGFEVNLKAVYGSDLRLFASGGISTNRLAFDYYIPSTGDSGNWFEEYYWGFQGAAGAQYVFANSFSVGAEYKYKVYTDDEIDHQEFFTINFGYQF